jgi:hypothetical protein
MYAMLLIAALSLVLLVLQDVLTAAEGLSPGPRAGQPVQVLFLPERKVTWDHSHVIRGILDSGGSWSGGLAW